MKERKKSAYIESETGGKLRAAASGGKKRRQANRSTKSLNDIFASTAQSSSCRRNSETTTGTTANMEDVRRSTSGTRIIQRVNRRRSSMANDLDDGHPENDMITMKSKEDESYSQNSIPPRRRSKKRIVDFDGLDEPPTKVELSSTSDSPRRQRLGGASVGRGRRASRSATNILARQERTTPRAVPLLRSQMSDPGDCSAVRRRKRDSCGKSLMDFTGNEPQSVSYSAVFGGRYKGNFDPLSCSMPALSSSLNGLAASSTPNLRRSSVLMMGNSSLEDSWKSMYAAMVTSQAAMGGGGTVGGGGPTPASVRNPNKAVLTLEYPSTRILIGNDAAHRLFALGHDQLVGHRLTDMILHPSAIFQTDGGGPLAENGDTVNHPTTASTSEIDRGLTMASLSSERSEELTDACGKVIEIVDALESVSPAAIWLYPLIQQNQTLSMSSIGGGKDIEMNSSSSVFDRCLAVLEPVERINASCTLGPMGRIFACDDFVADMFGYRSSSEILGSPITELVPAVVLPISKQSTDSFRQNLTGRYRNGASFPVTVKLFPQFDADMVVKYDVTFYVYSTISGLITVLPNGTIHSFNNHFVATMFGVRPECLNEKNITTIIPKFYSENGSMDADVSCGNSFSFDENSMSSPIARTFPDLSLNDQQQNGWTATDFATAPADGISMKNGDKGEGASSNNNLWCLPNSASGRTASAATTATINGDERTETMRTVDSATNGDGLEDDEDDDVPPSFTSTPTGTQTNSKKKKMDDGDDGRFMEDDSREISEGSFWGFGLHRDGSLFGIGYQIRRLVLKDGSVLYCIWVVRDPEALICHNLTRFGANMGGFGKDTSQKVNGKTMQMPPKPKVILPNKMPLDLESEEKEYIRGEYAQVYDTLQQIGKGAYGCVKMAARKSDGLLVVTKFIRKDRILTDCWMENNRLGRVPIEIYLLTKLRHENIVKTIDVFQNESHYQVVMEKHGFGMDLFEFIDRHPLMDEKLASHLFRQVVSAVSYLHGQNIVHRDIKDENVIIDEHFRCKLIDFGSAAYFKEGKTFSTICGTIEYCSPEVLTGNRYAGPELEIWSMGILLYTLMFFENPFDNVEETIQANLEPPWELSEGLYELLSWMLHPCPANRAIISDVEHHWWVNQVVDIEKYKIEDVIIINDLRELQPPTNLKDLKTAEATQTSPGLLHTTTIMPEAPVA